MPELPEVETTRLALLPHITGEKILRITIHNPNLRWQVDKLAISNACSQHITSVKRRSKYLIIQTPSGFLLSHLGMSGFWKIIDNNSPLLKHDHIQINFANFCLRYHDTRRFGSFQWFFGQATKHEVFNKLGIEPVYNPDFKHDFNALYLKKALQNKKGAIKPALMDAKMLVGVGNIYASEALFMAGIHPNKLANRIGMAKLELLCQSIVRVLENAIQSGGTTLKDFINPNHQTGYFQLSLNVYGRDGQACHQCQKPIKKITQAGRSTFYCQHCQS